MIPVLLALLIFTLVVSLAFFLSRTLSPIPFFPTNKKDLQLILSELFPPRNTKYDIRNTIIDLGAGIGTVIFPAALEAYKKKSTTQFYAVEIHPLLIFIMHIKRLFHPNRINIHIVRADIFNLNIKNLFQFYTPNTKYQILNTIYLYVGPFVMTRLKPVLKSFPKGTRIVSYMYEIPGWEKMLIRKIRGNKELYVYGI